MEGPEIVDTSAATLIVVVLGLVGTIVLGIIPGPAMTFFQNASEFLRLGMM